MARLNWAYAGRTVRRARLAPKECDYIMPALLAGSSDLECLPYQGRDCIKDFSAGGTLFPSVSDLSSPRGPYVTDGPVGHPGTLSPSTFMTEMTARQLLCPTVVAQTRPMEGYDISVNPDMLPTATSVTTEVSDQEWMEIDTPDPVESGMETTGGSPPAVSDISGDTDVLQTAISETGQVSEKWMVIDSPDAVESGMEMAGGSPPAEVDISVGPDVLLTGISVMTVVPEKWVESLQEPMPAEERLEYGIQATALIWEPLE